MGALTPRRQPAQHLCFVAGARGELLEPPPHPLLTAGDLTCATAATVAVTSP